MAGLKGVISAIICVAAITAFCAAPGVCAPVEIRMTQVKGHVLYLKADGKKWEKATESVIIKEGARVKTRSKASVVLTFSGHTVKFATGTTALIAKADMTGTTETTLIVVESGTVFANVEKMTDDDSVFTVNTPATNIVMRGVNALASAKPKEEKVPAPPK